MSLVRNRMFAVFRKARGGVEEVTENIAFDRVLDPSAMKIGAFYQAWICPYCDNLIAVDTGGADEFELPRGAKSLAITCPHCGTRDRFRVSRRVQMRYRGSEDTRSQPPG